MNLIIFGPQGSGKGTQADLLSKKYNLAHLETGMIFRKIGREDSELGRKVFDIINTKKELISDDLTADIVRHYLEKIPAEQGVIIDSAPRTIGQIEPIEEMLQKLARPIKKAIYITLPYAESVSRITKRYACTVCHKQLVLGKHIHGLEESCPACGGKIMQRGDDTPDGVAKRLDTFYEVTIPVIDQYRERGMLIEVDGNQSVESVFGEIIKQL